MDGDDYTYDRHLPPQTGPDMLRAELSDLRMQLATLVEAHQQLALRVAAMGSEQRPRPAGIVSVVDWEDNL